MSDIRDLFIAALKDVDDAEVPQELREIAFVKAVEMRMENRDGTSTGNGSGAGAEALEHKVLNGGPLANIAAKLGLSSDAVDEVYNENDGELELIVSARRLADRNAPATKELALAIAAGRQAAGLEEWTSLDTIRTVCSDFNKLDAGNFASTIKEMDDVFATRSPSARKREVRLNRPGWDAARDLVRRLAGGGD